MPDKKANHTAPIVRLKAPRVHTNADTLEIYDIPMTGYQVVTKKGNFNEGDLAVYIQPDSVVPQTEPFRFIWDTSSTEGYGTVPEKARRITVRKFRKEWSEGLLMPTTDFPDLYEMTIGLGLIVSEGEDVSDILGITHYIADAPESTAGTTENPRRKYPKTLRGWFYFLLHKIGFRNRQFNEDIAFNVPDFDVENFKNFKDAIQLGDDVIVTEKIHGSQAKFVFVDGKMYAGSRNFWKAPKSPCAWRKALVQNPWIEKFCREHEGCILYGEVVPTQKGFNYGCENGEVKVFVFDIRHANGDYVGKKFALTNPDLNTVPVLYHGMYYYDVLQLADGESTVGSHVREGAVITVTDPTRWQRGLGRIQLKIVSNAFLEKDRR